MKLLKNKNNQETIYATFFKKHIHSFQGFKENFNSKIYLSLKNDNIDLSDKGTIQ